MTNTGSTAQDTVAESAVSGNPPAQVPSASPWLNVKQAAAYIQAGPKTVYRAVEAGHLRAARLGGRRDIRLRREWLDDYLERCAVGGR
jgi:excisionase family DNA binding protein